MYKSGLLTARKKERKEGNTERKKKQSYVRKTSGSSQCLWEGLKTNLEAKQTGNMTNTSLFN